MTDAKMAEAQVTDEMLESMRARAGLELRIEHSVFNEEATRLAIAKFAAGIGDHNPLWKDPAYAATSPWNGVVAPPSFVIGVFSGLQFGWPGLGSFHAGTTVELHGPVRLGDVVTPVCVYDGFDGPRPSSFATFMIVDHFTNTYRNQDGTSLATIKWSVVNFERERAKQTGRDGDLQLPHPWTEDEVREIEEQVLGEEPRGAEARWWEDVEVDDRLDCLTKGPIGITDEIAFVAGGGAPIPRLAANGVALRSYRRHPPWAFRDPQTKALEPIYAVHYNRHAARAMGVALEYDVGFQRQCWQLQLLSNWMGDSGWVKRADTRYRRFVYLGDVVRLEGTVTRKYVDGDGEPCVDVTTTAVNQRGEEVMPGSATIALPSRELGTSPVDRRR
ncbi:MAG: MaoC family dehydratase N-terminal domain-containing protein [Acidimicrobiia bacterium]|nr:MaoC family dehydratase N-terminal domain-containing protein [Acidimicrobiia bacterium]